MARKSYPDVWINHDHRNLQIDRTVTQIFLQIRLGDIPTVTDSCGTRVSISDCDQPSQLLDSENRNDCPFRKCLSTEVKGIKVVTALISLRLALVGARFRSTKLRILANQTPCWCTPRRSSTRATDDFHLPAEGLNRKIGTLAGSTLFVFPSAGFAAGFRPVSHGSARFLSCRLPAER